MRKFFAAMLVSLFGLVWMPPQAAAGQTMIVFNTPSGTDPYAKYDQYSNGVAAGPNSKLLVFLPGSDTPIGQTRPSNYQDLLNYLAVNRPDLKILALDYKGQTVGTQCSLYLTAASKVKCYNDAREELYQNISQRILARLNELAGSNFGSSQFISGGQINWSKVILSGHSQGAGEAGYFATKQDRKSVV